MTTIIPASLSGWNHGDIGTSTVRAGDLSVGFNARGDLAAVRLADLQISQYPIGCHDSPVGGMWLRHHAQDGLHVAALTGAKARSNYRMHGNTAQWTGQSMGVDWDVTLVAGEGSDSDAGWTWVVDIRPEAQADDDVHAGTWDIVTAQDLALAPVGQALTSEPYISQYIAFHAYTSDTKGAVLAARQTMACAPLLPLYLTSIREGCRGYLTDGFDFYGTTARLGREPQALYESDWSANRIDQYEFSMACMQAEPRQLQESLAWHVDNVILPDYQGELDEICARFAARTSMLGQSADSSTSHTRPRLGASLLSSVPMLNGDDLDNQELGAFSMGQMQSPEYDDSGQLLSFFSNRARHVVAKRKELRVARSHGQILLAGCEVVDPDRHAFAATTYAPGVFASHVVLGNTNLNRLVSVQHTSLNLLRSQGVRILVKLPDNRDPRSEQSWRMLGVPSVYIMEIGGSQWVYRIGDCTITVDTTAASDSHRIDIRLRSTVPLDVMMSVDIEQSNDWNIASEFNRDLSGIILVPATDTAPARACPGLSYALASTDAHVSGDSALFDAAGHGHNRGSGVLLFTASDTSMFQVAMTAGMDGPERLFEQVRELFHGDGFVTRHDDRDRESVLQRHYDAVSAYSQQLQVHDNDRLREFNIIVPWFMQNALVHFLSPHGLEQYSGAAWGTRDVCQGPLESALAFGHYDVARQILLKVFGHQNRDGSLPQWFMFDEYAALYQHDAHGDIPVWPIMAVAEYLEATSDWSILDTAVGFWNEPRDGAAQTRSTVSDHLERTLSYIRAHRVPGTELFSYGEGDWDDTLQPARESMKKDMASTWTIALLYQASHALDSQLRGAGSARTDALADAFATEASIIHANFASDFIFDGVLAGYVSFPGGKASPMIHPNDRRTGIAYRLIPMTRSIIAGLFDAPTMRRHEAIVEQHLHYPDGVRLMSSPAAFHDGITTVFKRAEQAANVGREIGLMYTHAHIRYAEALAALGRERLGDELLRISPVGQYLRLKNSEPRQRNCYFASSDADFPDRYTAARQWHRLRQDDANPVGVRGGWRVYSSGPGIYLRQMMQHLFGIQLHTDHVVFDPILEPADDGTVVDVMLFGVLRHIRYHVLDDASPVTVSVGGRPVSGQAQVLPYRRGGISICAQALSDETDIAVSFGVHR